MTDDARTSAPDEPKPKRHSRSTDWEAVERDYRTTHMTVRELEAKYGCSNSRISQRAKKYGWSRDLMPAIKLATEAKLISAAAIEEEVSSQVKQTTRNLTNSVLIAAEINKNIILGHRKGLKEITETRDVLRNQVFAAASNLPDLEEVIEMLRKPDESGVDKANDAMRRALSRSSLVDDLKKLAEIDERVRKGEREAFNIQTGESDKPKDSLSELLDALAERGSRLPIASAAQ